MMDWVRYDRLLRQTPEEQEKSVAEAVARGEWPCFRCRLYFKDPCTCTDKPGGRSTKGAPHCPYHCGGLVDTCSRCGVLGGRMSPCVPPHCSDEAACAGRGGG